jgi:hypothetical protein
MRQMRGRNALFLAGLALVVMGAAAIWRTNAQTVIPAGYDQFSTPANGGTQETLSLPAGFFTDSSGSASSEFNGQVVYEGGQPVTGYTGDTVIERTATVQGSGPTPLQVIGLNLAGVSPITVQFADGTSASYAVSVSQSPSVASTGTMTFASGGTFTNTLSINRAYNFTPESGPPVFYDAAANGWPAIPLSSSGTWSVSGKGKVIIIPVTEKAPTHVHVIVPAPTPCVQTDESRIEDATIENPSPCVEQDRLIKKELNKRKP